MPRPTKRSLALREAGRNSAKTKKLKKSSEEKEEEWEIPDSAPSEGALSTDSDTPLVSHQTNSFVGDSPRTSPATAPVISLD